MSSSPPLPLLVCAGTLVACFVGTDGPPSAGESTTGTNEGRTDDATGSAVVDTTEGNADSSGDASVDDGPADADTTDTMDTADTGAIEQGSVAGGSVHPLPDVVDNPASGFALIVRRDDRTELSLAVSALQPHTLYEAYVHTAPCADDGGPRYPIDPAGSVDDPDNVLALAFSTEGSGYARSLLTTEHLATADARSVVVHDVPTGDEDPPKMLCADLVTTGSSDPFLTQGTGIVLVAAMDAGLDALSTTATMERAVADGTTVTLLATGLAPDTGYAVHVHERDCTAYDGGAHYKIDDTIGGTNEANELWLPLTTDAEGSGQSSIVSDHLARASAQSIVVHDGARGGPRLTCIDLDVD